MTFAKAIESQAKNIKTTTENGMPMRVSSSNYAVDLFFNIGAMRTWTESKKIQAFSKAFKENEDLATRVLLWARDIRGGAGERATFRTIIKHLCVYNYSLAERILLCIPELGRWDDVLEFMGTPAEVKALNLISVGLNSKDANCAKWLPRHKAVYKQAKKMEAAGASKKEIETALKRINDHNVVVGKIRKHMNLNFKTYRKLLSSLSSTVEQQMCSKKWNEINYSHVPSIASKNYRKAFNRNDEQRYQEYLNALTKGVEGVKVNADAIFPHDVIKPLMKRWGSSSATQQTQQLAQAQWDALPDYMDGTKVLPMVDSSGSMGCDVGGGTTAMQIAFSLGLYISSKNKGDFKDVIMTFSHNPTLMNLNGDLSNKVNQLYSANWGMTTNLEKAFQEVLEVSIKNKVPEKDMPEVLLILSDMQFDSCTRDPDKTVMSMLRSEYARHGYELPKVVFWNIRGAGTTPVKATKEGTALVSGFSPSILKSILGSIEDFTPKAIMLKAVMQERYNY